MIGRFRKMHGLGNDFVVIDARANALEMTSARARAIADRHLGIGCDQLILIGPSDEEIGKHTSELQSLMRISYAVFCLKTKNVYVITIVLAHLSHTDKQGNNN